jgi:hypothetical protein
MRTYIGKRTAENGVVEVARYDIRGRKKTRTLRHIPFHSPLGFGWGYHGSGPADLALAILVDYLQEHPPRKGWLAGEKFARWAADSRALRHHQYFKRDVIAKLADEWEIHDSQIAAWLQDREANAAARTDAETEVDTWMKTRERR